MAKLVELVEADAAVAELEVGSSGEGQTWLLSGEVDVQRAGWGRRAGGPRCVLIT
jgi:hypothetical protein